MFIATKEPDDYVLTTNEMKSVEFIEKAIGLKGLILYGKEKVDKIGYDKNTGVNYFVKILSS